MGNVDGSISISLVTMADEYWNSPTDTMPIWFGDGPHDTGLTAVPSLGQFYFKIQHKDAIKSRDSAAMNQGIRLEPEQAEELAYWILSKIDLDK